MSVKDTTYIITLKDKNRTKICKFCGQPIEQIHKKDTTGSVRDWNDWTEYECNCEEWQKYEECIQTVNRLNNGFLEAYREYKEQLRNTNLRGYKGIKIFEINKEYSKEF